MTKIITFGINLNDEHKQRLEQIWTLEIFDSPESTEEFVAKSQ